MKHQVDELSGALLDMAVATAEGLPLIEITDGLCRCAQRLPGFHGLFVTGYSPSTQWRLGGPLIEKHGIRIERSDRAGMLTAPPTWCAGCVIDGPTALVAAMRYVVWVEYGDEVEQP